MLGHWTAVRFVISALPVDRQFAQKPTGSALELRKKVTECSEAGRWHRFGVILVVTCACSLQLVGEQALQASLEIFCGMGMCPKVLGSPLNNVSSQFVGIRRPSSVVHSRNPLCNTIARFAKERLLDAGFRWIPISVELTIDYAIGALHVR